MEQAIAHFTEHDVVAAPVNTIPQAAEDPHPWERRAMVEVPDFLAGEIAVSGDYWHFSRTPVNVGSTPQVGEHNEEVLSGILDYSEEEVEAVPAEPGHLRGTLLRRDTGVGMAHLLRMMRPHALMGPFPLLFRPFDQLAAGVLVFSLLLR